MASSSLPPFTIGGIRLLTNDLLRDFRRSVADDANFDKSDNKIGLDFQFLLTDMAWKTQLLFALTGSNTCHFSWATLSERV